MRYQLRNAAARHEPDLYDFDDRPDQSPIHAYQPEPLEVPTVDELLELLNSDKKE